MKRKKDHIYTKRGNSSSLLNHGQRKSENDTRAEAQIKACWHTRGEEES